MSDVCLPSPSLPGTGTEQYKYCIVVAFPYFGKPTSSPSLIRRAAYKAFALVPLQFPISQASIIIIIIIIIMPPFRSLVHALLLLASLATTITTVHALAGAPKPTYGGGGGVGRLVLEQAALKYQTHYDMLLVERLQKRKAPQDVGEGSLYVPDEDLPRLHLCRVISVGPGREEENGSVAPDLDGIKPGDLILAKDPWGIGPKDEELEDGTKLSYMRSLNVAAKLTGDLVPETK